MLVGNSFEIKYVILFDHVQTPHYNYVGDTILGYFSYMGADSIMVDYAEVGCNSVYNPGTIIGRHSNIYPTSFGSGIVPATQFGRIMDRSFIRKIDE